MQPDVTEPAIPHFVPTPDGRFSLSRLTEELRATSLFESTGQAARTLVKRRELTVVLVLLRADAVLHEHRVAQPVSIQAVSGRATLRLGAASSELVAGDLQILAPGAEHDVEAREETALLITIPAPGHPQS
ncbi:MAG: hypothetical protein OZ921_08160 [Sorangiineae bacterium]|nr:hypothetical protein [Polyangiaceae bacterium]MEB2322472.1 hypothetical protein [Sorangiineae bacterium]